MTSGFPVGEHDQRLVSLVHPADWVSPEPADRYNLVVIGGGTAGLVTAMGAAGLGARVALVEANLLGGDCLNTGCVPSKALIASARVAAGAGGDAESGGRPPQARAPGAAAPTPADFPAVMERMRRIRASIAPHDSAARLREAGVDVFFGRARFVGRSAVEVVESSTVLRFSRAAICTGASPIIPPVDGLAEADYLTSETLFDLTERPARLAVIGAGPIGCELAQAMQRLGSQVTMVSLDDQVLPREELEAAESVEAQLRSDGLELRLGSRVERVSRSADGWVLEVKGSPPGSSTVDRILVAAGRRPNVSGMSLDKAGVSFSRDGVEVDDFLRTTNRRIYAAGDVTGAWQFTHAADAMARIVIQNALFFGRKRLSDLTMSWCTYTDPEVAHAGLTPEAATREGRDVVSQRIGMDRMDRSITDGDTAGYARIISDRSSGRLLGATVVASHAGDLLAPAVVAMGTNTSVSEFASLILPYPTRAEIWKRFGDEANRRRLTPRVKGLLAMILRWRR